LIVDKEICTVQYAELGGKEKIQFQAGTQKLKDFENFYLELVCKKLNEKEKHKIKLEYVKKMLK